MDFPGLKKNSNFSKNTKPNLKTAAEISELILTKIKVTLLSFIDDFITAAANILTNNEIHQDHLIFLLKCST